LGNRNFGHYFRFYFIYIQQGQGLITLTCIDCFAWGGLLSWYRINQVQDQLHRLLRYTVLPSLAILLYVSFVKDNTATLVKILFLRTAISCISAYILSLICSPKPHWLNTVLSSAPMVFVGKISYGVYVYHMTVPLLFWFVWQKFHLPAIGNHFTSLIVLLVASYLSWILFEKPINNLKKYFPYQTKK
jgi:peptidoglycan/LPS O-acetylase OafA/YrhL